MSTIKNTKAETIHLVESVNNILPDEHGNVTVEGGFDGSLPVVTDIIIAAVPGGPLVTDHANLTHIRLLLNKPAPPGLSLQLFKYSKRSNRRAHRKAFRTMRQPNEHFNWRIDIPEGETSVEGPTLEQLFVTQRARGTSDSTYKMGNKYQYENMGTEGYNVKDGHINKLKYKFGTTIIDGTNTRVSLKSAETLFVFKKYGKNDEFANSPIIGVVE